MATPERNPEPTQLPDQAQPHLLVPEEIDSSKWQMPPWAPIGMVLLVILIALGIASYVLRPKPKATGNIEDVYAVALDANNTMATVKLGIANVGNKALWIKNLKVKVVTPKGEYTDDAAAAVDFPRYFSGYPDIRQHTITPIKVEDKIDPHSQERGSVIVGFKIPLDEFNSRKSISVIVEPYDQAPITITK